MRKSIWTGTCASVVALATAAVFAQQTTPAPQTAQPNTASSSANRVTVTGCLKAAPQSDTASAAGAAGATTAGTTGTTGAAGATGTAGTTGTSGAASAASSDAKYVLADATVGTPSSTSDTAGAGTTAETTASPAASSGAKQTYRLIANPAALTPHVNKKLELTGTLEENASATPSETTTGSAASGPALRVESGKVLAASCSEP